MARTIYGLASRIHQRWKEYRRRYPGRSVPIDDTLSRIMRHAASYQSSRAPSLPSRRAPLLNPGIFTVQKIADALETTVGDLLGEPGYESPRDWLTSEDRRTLRDAVRILVSLFDLDDPAI
jgi:hypothetical protein